MRYSYTSPVPFKVVNYQGETLRDSAGKLLTGFKGYRDANVAAKEYGGVAVRT